MLSPGLHLNLFVESQWMPRLVWVEDYKSKPQTQRGEGGAAQRRKGPQLENKWASFIPVGFLLFSKAAVPAGHFTRSCGFWNFLRKQKAEALTELALRVSPSRVQTKLGGLKKFYCFKQASDFRVEKQPKHILNHHFLQNQEASQNNRGIRFGKSG